MPVNSYEKTWWNWENLDSFSAKQTIPQTDTGEQVEYTKALERTMQNDLVTSGEGVLSHLKIRKVTHTRG